MRRTFVIVDGENIDATLGGILARRPQPEERPRWGRVLEVVGEHWQTPVRGLFFLAVTDELPTAFVQAILAMDYRKIPGAIMITRMAKFNGIVSAPPSLAPTFLQLDVFGALGVGIVQVVLVFVLVEVFDATGTLIGVAKRAYTLQFVNKSVGVDLRPK